MTHAPAKGAGIGEAVIRKEDHRLVTGAGTFSDDVNLPGQAYAFMLRSPHASARIRGIDTSAALKSPGVVAILTAKDLKADGVKEIPHRPFSPHPADIMLYNSDGTDMFMAPHYPLVVEKVRHVGEAVAMVIAESVAAAKDAAELIEVDYDVLDAVANTAQAAEMDAPKVFDEARSNVCLDALTGDGEATAAAFRRAKHVVKFETWVPRITGVPLEPRAAVGEYDSENELYTLHAGTSGAWRTKMDIAIMLGVPENEVRVITNDVGGHFGTRGMLYGEFTLVVWAAKRIGRPVKWTCERAEAFATDYQARDLVVEAELALDAEGTFLAMRGSNISNAGGHTTNFSPLRKGVEISSSIYRVPAAHFRARGVVSNTSPTRPYRSSGRPEVLYVMERLIDLAAREKGFDRIELRRRNLVSESEMPYTNPFGMVYDSGSYHAVMEKALQLGDWTGFPARKAEAKQRGKCRGIGVANYVDTSSGVPRERAEVTVKPDGSVDVIIGTVSTGQGHETSFAQLVTEWLGVPFEKVNILTGDTAFVKFGGGTHSGRGLRTASVVIYNASQDIIEKGKRIAALLLECEASAVEFAAGEFTRPGGRKVTLRDVARAAVELPDVPEELRGPLEAVCDQEVEAQFPYGCQVVEVEIDPDLGTLEIVKYTAVDDVGRAVNPGIIHGQVHGGIAQGVGQALMEHCHYDPETGQLLSGSFMDYAMPRADDFPFFNTEYVEIPSTHPLGLRPAGEGGTAPALGVMINAICDALSEFGVRHVEMPATPERIWRAIRDAQSLR
ncbi:MAG TPA: xanthine dehydrogenase family protein molybdopterin-binding subunit [Burkholderiales bacterium]|nr:xanthine dehydrogenase family protein molybdopterin-binding subunit [Burkholderiales bacterium]